MEYVLKYIAAQLSSVSRYIQKPNMEATLAHTSLDAFLFDRNKNRI